MAERSVLVRRIRFCLAVVIAGLVVSGVTAFPLREEVALGRGVLRSIGLDTLAPVFVEWVDRVGEGLDATAAAFPFIAYGTDWLAFAHLLIALAFIGPWRDPVRNVFIIQWGLVACAGIVPLALIAGALRGLPLGWQVIDLSFGVVAALPLAVALVATRRLEALSTVSAASPAAAR